MTIRHLPWGMVMDVRALKSFMLLSFIMKLAFTLLMMAQLVAPNFDLPKVMSARLSAPRALKAGQKTDITVSFNVLNGYKINRDPVFSLTVTPIPGVKLDSTTVEASPEDKKSHDEYYVDVPDLKVAVTPSNTGRFELPAKLTYFFCSKSDGFCAKQTVDVKIPLRVE